MKKLIFLFAIMLLSLKACPQTPETEFDDLVEILVNSGVDQAVIYRSGVGYRMTIENVLGPLNDSIASHLVRIEALEAGSVSLGSQYQIPYTGIDDFAYSPNFTFNGTDLLDVIGDIRISDNIPSFIFYEQDAPIDEKNWTIKTTNGDLQFMTANDAYTGDWSDKVTIARNGNVGIGETSPVVELDVTGEVAATGNITTDTEFRIEDATTRMYKDGSNNWVIEDAVTGAKTLGELAAGGGAYTFERGITESVGTVYLGGDIPWGEDVLIRQFASNLVDYGTFYLGAGSARIGYYDQSVGQSTAITTSSTLGVIVSDGARAEGAYYGGDYSTNGIANRGDRWIPDKGYVDGVAGGLSAINAQVGTSYTLQLSDKNNLITLTNGSPITLTVPPNSSEAFDIRDQAHIVGLGAGQVTVAEGAGVTIIAADGADKLRVLGSTGTLTKINTDTWLFVGDITL